MTIATISAAKGFPYYYLFALWPLALVLIWAVWNSVRDSKDEELVLRSLKWPETDGKVTSSDVQWAHVEICYEYRVNDIGYTGTYEISLTPNAPDKYGRGARRLNQEAGESLKQFPTGSDVIIRYNPKRPEESVLYCGGKVEKANP